MDQEPESLFHPLRAEIDEALDSSEATSDDVKEVYARFGLAYYHAEVLYRGLCNLYCASQVPPMGPVTRYRMEEHLRTASEMTLGQLLPRLETVLPASLLERLAEALERRNFIAHRFWFERIHLFATLSGIEAMVTELAHDTELFQDLDREVERITEPFHVRIGLTPELSVTAFNEVKRGEVVDPLHSQRMPRKQETVVKVFNVPAGSGNAVLVFQTDDGLLWQLCDAGLGWSPYDLVDPLWPSADKFTDLLPARINPRPKASAPWTFEIQFGARATLAVYPGQNAGDVICRLRKRDKQAARRK
ncbi:MAG TPA: hypothetical protein VG675_02225 [Bryobacteraceae bacterium]|nr:hypothetical protein [Bryobacteraceae bacterium]